MEHNKDINEILLCKVHELNCSADAIRSLDISEGDKALALLGQITDLFYASHAIASASADATQGAGHEQ